MLLSKFLILLHATLYSAGDKKLAGKFDPELSSSAIVGLNTHTHTHIYFDKGSLHMKAFNLIKERKPSTVSLMVVIFLFKVFLLKPERKIAV